MSIVNISAYKFIRLDDLPALRERLLRALRGAGPEGHDPAGAGGHQPVSGRHAARRSTVSWLGLHADPRFADIAPKESLSDARAVRPHAGAAEAAKSSPCAMPTIRPEGGRAPAVDAATLQRWLDQGHDDDGREVVLLDTRNDYETDVGKFAAGGGLPPRQLHRLSRPRWPPIATATTARPSCRTAPVASAAKRPRCTCARSGWSTSTSSRAAS